MSYVKINPRLAIKHLAKIQITLYLSMQYISDMLENIAYIGVGFATVLLALEAAWHFTACKINDKSIKPCLYKQIGILK
jgi:hypothetical protein